MRTFTTLALLTLLVSLVAACGSAKVLNVEGPQRVAINEPATFTAEVNNKGAKSDQNCWEFGDGTTERNGTTVTHAYSEAGTYTVRFRTPDCEATKPDQTQTFLVEVYDPCPIPAEIVALSTDPSDPIFNETIRFNATVNANPAATFTWDFGDGNTSTSASPTHRYTDPGVYTVTLAAANCEAQPVSRTLEVVVGEFRCSEVRELNSVFFEENSAVLDDEAYALLDENIAILNECAELNARLDAYTSYDERRMMDLGNQRAAAVQSYYSQNGVSLNRLTARSMGAADRQSAKAGDQRRNRRVDSIVLR